MRSQYPRERTGSARGVTGSLRFASVGELCLHEYAAFHGTTEVGGGSWYFATQVAALGYAVRVVGAVGRDAIGDAVAAGATAPDLVEVSLVRAGPRTAHLLIDDPRADEPAAAIRDAALEPEALLPTVHSLSGVHRVHLPAFPGFEGVQRAVAAQGIPILADFGYKPWLRKGARSLLEQVLRRLDGVEIALLNVKALPAEDALDVVNTVAAAVPVVVATRGAGHAIVAAGGLVDEIAAIPTTNVCNSFGAGDAFFAGFVVALEEEHAPVAAARYGHATAAARIATGRPTTRAEVDRMLEGAGTGEAVGA